MSCRRIWGGLERRGVELYPGMQTEVMIVTGARSALDYLLEPLMKSFNRAFRES